MMKILNVGFLAMIMSAQASAAGLMSKMEENAGFFFAIDSHYCASSVTLADVARIANLHEIREAVTHQIRTNSQFSESHPASTIVNLSELEDLASRKAAYSELVKERLSELEEETPEDRAESLASEKKFKDAYLQVVARSGTKVLSGTARFVDEKGVASKEKGRVLAVKSGARVLVIVRGYNGC